MKGRMDTRKRERRMNKFLHVHKSLRYLMGSSKTTRSNYLQNKIWIDHPAAVNVINTLEGLMSTGNNNTLLMMIGDAGSGKSEISNRFKSQNPVFSYYDKDDFEQFVLPVTLINCRSVKNKKELYTNIINHHHWEIKVSDKSDMLRHQAIASVKKYQTKVLILENVQGMLGNEGKNDITSAIALLNNALQIPIVLTSTFEGAKELSSRYTKQIETITLPSWQANEDFISLLASFEMRLPLKKQSNLLKKDKATALFTLSKGNIGTLHQLLIKASLIAIESGKERITLEIIGQC